MIPAATPVDPHSYARPDEARVVHVSLDLEVDFEARRLRGSATLDVALLRPTRELVLDTRGLVVEEVFGEDGEPLPFALAEADALLGAALTVTLPKPSPSMRDATRVTIRYATGPGAPALDWLEPAQTAGGEHPFLFTQGHAIETRSWIPLQDSPGIRQTYDARILVPRALSAVMSAEQRGPTDAADPASRVFAFEMREPVPSYLIALVVGELGFHATGPRSGVYAEAATLARAAYELGEMEAMIEAAERLVGPYRWERFDVVVMPPSFPYGGMENPRLTYASPTLLAGDRSLTTVIVHELAHAWAGNLVTNATWNDFWLNEGVTVYLELRLNEALWGEERAGILQTFGWRELLAEAERIGAGSPDTRLRYDMTGRDPVVGVTAIPYLKGAALFWTLERRVGRERLDAWLRGYFDRHAFTSVTTDELVADLRAHLFIDEASPVDLEAWIDAPDVRAEGAPPPSPALARVDACAVAFAEGASPASLDVTTWRPQEWRHFLVSLQARALAHERLEVLDRVFALSSSTNAEILAAWLRLAAKRRYDPALPALERFLTENGRGKYLRPLYGELVATPWGASFARRVFDAARPRYHTLVRTALARLLDAPPPAEPDA